jgi:glutathionylspermidine synthase
MTSRSTLIESLATSILDSKGIGAIWQLHLYAAHAYETGYPIAADAILELAEAAERVLMRRENASVNIEQQQ